MNKQTGVILKEIEKINQEILILSQRVNKLEDIILHQEVKNDPKNDINAPNLDKIIESANIAMDKFNKRMNRES